MTSTVLIPTPLRAYVGGRREIAVQAATVQDALRALGAESAELRRHLLDDDGQLRRFVSVYVNDEDIRALAGPATPLADGDAIVLVPAIAGGATWPPA